MENNTLESAKDFVYNLRCYLPDVSIIDDYEGYNGYPPTKHEYNRMVNQLESVYFSFIRSFDFSSHEELELKKLFYGGDGGIVLVGVYEASRCYGGAEEGGWYYTTWHLIESKEMPYDEAINYINKIDAENDDVYEHQGKNVAWIELYKGQHEKVGTEHYS